MSEDDSLKKSFPERRTERMESLGLTEPAFTTPNPQPPLDLNNIAELLHIRISVIVHAGGHEDPSALVIAEIEKELRNAINQATEKLTAQVNDLLDNGRKLLDENEKLKELKEQNQTLTTRIQSLEAEVQWLKSRVELMKEKYE